MKQSKKRKEQLLAAINNEQAWSDYCINKKLTPFMQKTILSSYGIVRDPIHLPSKKTETSASKKFGSLKISYSSAENIDNEDEWKKYDSIEDWKADLTVFWAGKTDDIEFSYRKDYNSPKERKKVTPKELVFDGNKRIYIKGYCHQKQKDVHFNSEKIETKILAGSTRYDFEEWVERRLKVDVEDLSDKFGVWI
ncbi:hypothetical protein VAE151_560175 [Vibrio aestuarianus]|uniref:WYL domain-containing protein n=1 Tax=Vibrio aestuarianus TaxID=28171 RepID=UPI001456240F|nr:WYL domain-containing protein [Vibrio aestuarianus]NLS65248.1 WYL domain-containing protein [Vibrio aestuarianus subsp. francensis]CAH8213947.1 hypothetical protein VAE151_560175 [Vibrio aestuarianus]